MTAQADQPMEAGIVVSSKMKRTAESGALPEVADVRAFWDSLPLGQGAIPGVPGTREWFDEFDRIKRNDGLSGVQERWLPPSAAGMLVLDVGCGPGFWARFLIPQGIRYVGVDLSPRAVELARASLSLYGLTGQVEVANAEALPFDDATFDHVVSEGVIHHTPDTQACIDEVHRILVPGGTAAVSVYYRTLLLRSSWLLRMARAGMRLSGTVLESRGRGEMVGMDDPDEFVRLYDGAANPIGKAYTRKQLRAMFGAFSRVRMTRYFLPDAGPISVLPGMVRAMSSRAFGLMILIQATK